MFSLTFILSLLCLLVTRCAEHVTLPHDIRSNKPYDLPLSAISRLKSRSCDPACASKTLLVERQRTINISAQTMSVKSLAARALQSHLLTCLLLAIPARGHLRMSKPPALGALEHPAYSDPSTNKKPYIEYVIQNPIANASYVMS